MQNNSPFSHKPPTLKELLSMRKPYPYKEVSDKLNSLSPEELSKVDSIVAQGEIDSCNMVGIKKLFRMISNEHVKAYMKELYKL